jgi:hypothetical protein
MPITTRLDQTVHESGRHAEVGNDRRRPLELSGKAVLATAFAGDTRGLRVGGGDIQKDRPSHILMYAVWIPTARAAERGCGR